MRASLAIALAFSATGCISGVDDGGVEPMCVETADCDQAHGEVCDDGVCWGDPPEGVTFAAVLVPPDDRTDLPVAVVPALSIAADGTSNDWLYALGPMTRGAFWEIVAVPDIRQQTWNLARRLSNAQWVGWEGL